MNKEIKDACIFTFGYQFILWILACMALDGGIFMTWWGISICAYFISALMVFKRSYKEPKKTDIFYLKFGSLIIMGVSPLLMWLTLIIQRIIIKA